MQKKRTFFNKEQNRIVKNRIEQNKNKHTQKARAREKKFNKKTQSK